MELPSWIDLELWNEYVAQRKKDKKEMSPRSTRDRIARLVELNAKGHDANASIADALNHHWLDFYEPKSKEITNVKREYMTSVERQMSEEERARSAAAREEAMGKFRRLRRVA